MAYLGLRQAPMNLNNSFMNSVNNGFNTFNNIRNHPLLMDQEKQKFNQGQQLNQARINLLNNQSQQNKNNPLNNFNSVYGEYLQSKGQKKQALGQLLDHMVSGQRNGLPNISITPGGITTSQPQQQSIFGQPQSSPSSNNVTTASVNPTSVSSRSNKGAQVAYVQKNNPNAIVTTSPTNATQTSMQSRKAAEAESNYISPIIEKGVAPYNSGIMGNLSGLKDEFLSSFFNDPNATKRLQAYADSMGLVNSDALLKAKQDGVSKPGVEVLKENRNSIIPNTATAFSEFMPSSINTQQIGDTNNNLNNAATISNQVGAQNFPVSTNKSTLPYAGGNPMSANISQNSTIQNKNDNTVSMNDVKDYAYRSGQSVQQITQLLKNKGYIVNG